MKKLSVFLFATLVLFSCSINKLAYRVDSISIDYSKYTEKGFFFTESNSVNFDYTPIASITSFSESGYEVISVKNIKENKDADGTYYNPRSTNRKKNKYGDWKEVTPEETLDFLYNKATELGANGIIGLKTEYIPAQYKNNIIISPSQYVISGMAIKK